MYSSCNHSHFCNNNREFREYELYRGLGGVGGFSGNRRPDLGIDRRLDRLEPIFPEMLSNSHSYREFHGHNCWQCGCGRGYSGIRRSDICIDRRFDRLEPIPSATATMLPNNYKYGGEFGENKTISGFGSGGRYFGNRRLEPISSASATMLPKYGGEFRENKTVSEFGSGGGYFGSRRFDTRSNFSRSPMRPQNVKTADMWPRDRPKPIASAFGNKDQKALFNSKNNNNNNNNKSNISNSNTGSCRNGQSGGRGSRGRNSGERSQNKAQDEGGQRRQRFGYDNDRRQSSSGVKKDTSNEDDDWNLSPYTRNLKPDGFGSVSTIEAQSIRCPPKVTNKEDYLLFNTGFGAPNHPWLNPVDNGFGFGFSHATSTRPSGDKVDGFGGNCLDKKTVPDTIQKKDNHNQAGTLNGLSENTLFDGGFSRPDNRGVGDRGRDSEKHSRTRVRPDGRFCPDHVKTENMWDKPEPKPAVNKDDDW